MRMANVFHGPVAVASKAQQRIRHRPMNRFMGRWQVSRDLYVPPISSSSMVACSQARSKISEAS